MTGWRGEVRGHVLVDGKPELTVLGTRTGPESRGREMEKHRNRVLRPVMENLRLLRGLQETRVATREESGVLGDGKVTGSSTACVEGRDEVVVLSRRLGSAIPCSWTSKHLPV